MNLMGKARAVRSGFRSDEMGSVLLWVTKSTLAVAALPVGAGLIAWLLRVTGVLSDTALHLAVSVSLRATLGLLVLALAVLVAFSGRWAYQSVRQGTGK